MSKLTHRSLALEQMDGVDLEPTELQETLRGIERMNLLFGGNSCSLRSMSALVPKQARQVSMLDVGTGAGEIPRKFVEDMAKRGVRADVLAIDLSETSVAYAQQRSSAFTTLSFEAVSLFDVHEQFDIVHCAAMLHHVGDDDAIVGALAHMLSLAKHSVVVNDLHRHALAYYPIRFAAPFITRSKMVQNDAALSVWRAFNREELMSLARRAKWPAPQVSWHPMFRWILQTRV